MNKFTKINSWDEFSPLRTVLVGSVFEPSFFDGVKNKIELKKVRKFGLNSFLKKNKVFSYTITSPKTLSYTDFGYTFKSPIK